MVENSFPKEKDNQSDQISKFLATLAKYTDDKVDAMRKKKDEELAEYRAETTKQREQEMRRQQASANAAMQGGNPMQQQQMGAANITPDKIQKVRVRRPQQQ